MRRISLTAVAVVLVVTSVVGPVVSPTDEPAASDSPPVTAAATTGPQIASDLQRTPSALATDASPDRVAVVLETRTSASAPVARAVRAHGGRVIARIGRYVEARVPHRAVQTLAERADVTFVRRPYGLDANETTATANGEPGIGATGATGTEATVEGQGRVVSAGLDDLRVPRLHRNGVTGENVTVAVVGLGFDTDSAELAGNVARTKAFDPDGVDSGRHGTAVAELVVDTAPNASLVLVEVETMTEFARAVDWVDAETSADVAVASLGLSVGPFDGDSVLGRQLRQSDRHGTPWVVAAGNAGYRNHLNAAWRSTDGDRWLGFADGGDSVRIRSATGTVRVHVNWRDWPNADDDYDAYLQAWNGSAWVYVDQSETVQNGSQPPVEVLVASGHDRYRLRVWNRSAAGNTTFDVFLNDGAAFVDHYDRSRSVKRPAVVEPVVAVGAVREGTTTLEPYSSRGPTVDGALKPEVVAPDRVDTAAYGSRPFAGTSAAAPHVAGVAALVVAASGDSLSSTALRRTLRSTARDVRGTEPNNRTGYGLVDAESAVDALSAVSLDACARIDAPGRYGYATDSRAVNGSCVTITGDGVRVDGDGHTLAASDESSAVHVTNATNVSLTNARLRGRVGLAAMGSDVTVRNVTVDAREWAFTVDERSTLYARTVTLENGTVGVAGTGVRLAGVAAPNATLDRRHAGPYLRVEESPGEHRENATVELRISYEEVSDDSALRVWRFRNGSWTRVGGTVDTAANVVSASLEPGGVVTLYGRQNETNRLSEPRRVGTA